MLFIFTLFVLYCRADTPLLVRYMNFLTGILANIYAKYLFSNSLFDAKNFGLHLRFRLVPK